MKDDVVVFPSRNKTGSMSSGSSIMFNQRSFGRLVAVQLVNVQSVAHARPLLAHGKILPKVTRGVPQTSQRARIRTLTLWKVRAHDHPVVMLA